MPPAKKGLRVLGQHAIALLLLPIAPSAAWDLGDGFDARDATIGSVHEALFRGRTTCREVVSAFIARVEEFNPVINAVISLNPDALSAAGRLDEARVRGDDATGALFCVPVLLKDSYDAVGMSTTGGCRGLADNRPSADAPTVRALKDAGAIILGKANMHEMALEGLSVSSLGGQTVNPYDLTRTPGGSSGGSGAALAASMAVLVTGTDTVNSLRSPASANSLFSFRPTRGLISRAGVIPVSYTQDAVGAMARTPRDLAVALTVMASAGFDPRDNATALAPPEVRQKDYYYSTVHEVGGSLKGLRLGLINGFFNHTPSDETTPVNDVMTGMVSKLAAAGAEIVNITDPIFDALAIAKLDVQAFEYREQLDEYLANGPPRPSSPGTTSPRPTSFHDLYNRTGNNASFLVIPAQYPFLQRAAHSSTADAAYTAALRRIQSLTDSLRTTFDTNTLDALIYPEQKNLVVKLGAPSQSGRNGILAALTGHPVVCLPAGFSPPSAGAPRGVPVGMEVLGRPWSEDRLLNMASRISEVVPVRRRPPPPFADRAVAAPKCYARVPVVRPDVARIPAAYPLGVLGVDD